MLGRTAMKVLHDAPCPMVLVPPERGATPWHLQHVLVPHDGTPTTSAALQPAAELAERGGAELLVAHVTNIRAAPAEPGSLTTPRYIDQPQHEWPAWTNEFLKRLACVCPLGHLHVRIFLAHGNPAAEILRLSERQSTDLIVLAWRGRWEAPRAATAEGHPARGALSHNGGARLRFGIERHLGRELDTIVRQRIDATASLRPADKNSREVTP